MKTIELTDHAARIASLEEKAGIITVNLEWGGPNDRTVNDFDLAQLGDVTACGGNNSTGWVVLYGRCLVAEGDTIPLLPPPLFTVSVTDNHGDDWVPLASTHETEEEASDKFDEIVQLLRRDFARGATNGASRVQVTLCECERLEGDTAGTGHSLRSEEITK